MASYPSTAETFSMENPKYTDDFLRYVSDDSKPELVATEDACRDIEKHFRLRPGFLTESEGEKAWDSGGIVDDPSHPKHYSDLSPEPIDVIRAWKLNFNIGNAVKYAARAGRKGPAVVDLKKARAYLDHEIKAMESQSPDDPV